nr:zinc finger and BTB domain-containing protein 8A-like isoform X1 [Cherax quadricarinatus]
MDNVKLASSTKHADAGGTAAEGTLVTTKTKRSQLLRQSASTEQADGGTAEGTLVTQELATSQPPRVPCYVPKQSYRSIPPLRRIRKPNFTEPEKQLILSLIASRMDLMENKSLDRHLLKEKQEAWREVTKRYNATIAASGRSFVARDMDELRTFWKNLRRKTQWKEHRLAVPDLVERLSGGTCGSSEGKTEGSGEAEDEDTGLGVSLMDTEQSMDEDYLHDPQDIKSNVFQQSAELVSNNVGEETTAQDASGHAPSPTPSNQGLVGPYLLKKETHCSTVLDQLLRDDTYTDVTLTAEGQSLRAHRIVLCLASPYFRQVLSRELNVQSVVLLRDIKFAELRNIINFIYTGEATVDASELESFMRTAEMLEISSLCEGQKCISGRGLHTQGNFSSGFSIADFERLLGSKRSRKDSSPTPCKTRRVSGEGQSSRCSSAEPAATSIPLSLIKEEPGCETDSMLQSKSAQVVKENELLDVVERNEGGGESGGSRRESLESVGGFAAIAGVQKTLPNADDVSEDVFSSTAELSPNSQLAEAARQNAVTSVPDTMSVPGRCPYCPHLPQKYEGVAMMRHLLVAHPCKPAFPCDSCWRVFVKRVYFKAHQQKCSPPIS